MIYYGTRSGDETQIIIKSKGDRLWNPFRFIFYFSFEKSLNLKFLVGPSTDLRINKIRSFGISSETGRA